MANKCLLRRHINFLNIVETCMAYKCLLKNIVLKYFFLKQYSLKIVSFHLNLNVSTVYSLINPIYKIFLKMTNSWRSVNKMILIDYEACNFNCCKYELFKDIYIYMMFCCYVLYFDQQIKETSSTWLQTNFRFA